MNNGKESKIRPDYRSEKLKMVVEFDGLQHYQYANKILADEENDKIYKTNGYKVVRIPYFIQLTKVKLSNIIINTTSCVQVYSDIDKNSLEYYLKSISLFLFDIAQVFSYKF